MYVQTTHTCGSLIGQHHEASALMYANVCTHVLPTINHRPCRVFSPSCAFQQAITLVLAGLLRGSGIFCKGSVSRRTPHETLRPATPPCREMSACAVLCGSILKTAVCSMHLRRSTA